jgi:hypothetical protein
MCISAFSFFFIFPRFFLGLEREMEEHSQHTREAMDKYVAASTSETEEVFTPLNRFPSYSR